MLRLLANHNRLVCLIFLLCSISFEVLADEKAIINVSVVDTPIGQAVVASAKVFFTPLDFLKLIEGSETDCSWIEHCASVRVFEGGGSDLQLVQTEIDSPWPFKNRVMLVNSSLALSPDKQSLTITLTDAVEKEHVGDEQLIRMTNVSGEWKMEPLAATTNTTPNGFTLSYKGTGSPNGNIPKWVALSFLKSSTEQTFENLMLHFTSSH
jgi:hypothetical protein